MKNFLIYSKKSLKEVFNINEILNIRYLKQGVRIAYIFDITGIAYAFYKKLYILGFILLSLMVAFNILASVQIFAPYAEYILFFKMSLNIVLVIFGLEVEEFFLQRGGFKMKGFVFSKNKKTVRSELEEYITLKPFETTLWKRIFNKVRRKN